MFDLFNLDSALGIEIHQNDLVFATVTKGFSDFTLKKYAVLENYRDRPATEIDAWVEAYAESEGFSPENVVLGLPRDQVVLRQIELPLEAEENLDQVIRFQVETLEPREEDLSFHDYVVVERNESEKKLHIQIMMVRREYLDAQLDFFRQINLYPAAVRVSSLGLHQIFSTHEAGYPSEAPYLVLDINPEGVEFVLIAGRDHFCSEKILLDQSKFTFDRIVDELDRFLSHQHVFSYREDEEEGLAGIFLTGLLADQFLDRFREGLEECGLLEPGMTLKGMPRERPNLIAAVGLAISGVVKSSSARYNLIPKEKRFVAERPSLVPTLALTALVLVMGCAVTGRGYFQRSQILEQVRAEVTRLQPEAERVARLRDEVSQRQADLKEVQDMMRGQQQILLVLKELTERIPDNSYLQNLNISRDTVNMTGYSSSASELLEMLLKSEHLMSVGSRYITPDRSTNLEKFAFEAKIKE